MKKILLTAIIASFCNLAFSQEVVETKQATAADLNSKALEIQEAQANHTEQKQQTASGIYQDGVEILRKDEDSEQSVKQNQQENKKNSF